MPSGTGLLERGGSPGLKSLTQPARFTRLTVRDCSSTPVTATCRSRSCIGIGRAGTLPLLCRYEVVDAHTFTYHVQGALVRTLIGKDLKRVFELSGNQLIVKSPDPNEHWRVAWERD